MREYKLKIGETEYTAEVREITSEKAVISVNNIPYTVELLEFGRKTITAREFARPASRPDSTVSAAAAPPAQTAPSASSSVSVHSGEGVISPLPGLILAVNVSEGQKVQAGQKLILMEAMKMENHIHAPHTGTVKKILVKKDDNVMEGDVLMEISRPALTTM